MIIETERLRIYPASKSQMELFISSETDDELKAAYSEMLANALKSPDQWEWYAMWIIELRGGVRVGGLCFKGLNSEMSAEIGYGISDEYQRNGYATEAVKAVTAWAFQNTDVTFIKAETDPDNIASMRVLEKCGFLAERNFGSESYCFVLDRGNVKA